MIAVSDNTFTQEVLNNEGPVVVKFWAPWCNPCKSLARILEPIAESQQHIKFVEVNIDENPSLTMNYKVRGVPTLILFNNGKVIGTKVGLVNEAQLRLYIEQNLPPL